MAVNFYLDKRTDKKGDSPIRVSISIKGIRYLSSTGLKIAPAKWDGNKQQVRRGYSNSVGLSWTDINSILAKIAEHFTILEGECISSGKCITSDDLKKEFARNFGRRNVNGPKEEKGSSFFDIFDTFFIEESNANQWTEGTKKKLKTLKKHLQSFNSRLSFHDLGEKGLNNYISYLRDNLEMKNTTIGKQINLVKWFLRWATAKGYNSNMAFQTFSPKLKIADKKVIFLEWEELMRVFEYKIPSNGEKVILTDSIGKNYEKIIHDAAAIEKTRDIFCFCCFTSLRYSDAVNLKFSDISGNVMTVTTVKTADTVTIELNKYSEAILKKYSARKKNHQHVFPSITNQRMNLYLKDLCELCGINQTVTQTYYRGSQRFDETYSKYELIGTHTGRRTFICNALMLGIPVEIVMKWTGHSDYKAMKPYIDIANSAKAKAMDLFNRI